jgi:isopenicillin N synthase-like dioxygenase
MSEPIKAEAVHAIDFAEWRSPSASLRAGVAARIDRACRETGFIRLRNHGIPMELLQRLQVVTRGYFALDEATKRGDIYQPHHGNRGYAPFGGEALAASYGEETDAKSLPDLFEAFTIGPVGRPDDDYHRQAAAGRFFDPNLFPVEPAEFKRDWVEYYAACEVLANDLMLAFAAALGLAEDYFRPFIDRHITAMRALHYPALKTPLQPRQLRIGAHTDFGSLTILLSDGTPGLQVYRDGQWSDVVLEPDELLVNIGDLMADWTAGRWTSTLHRVVPSAPDRDRLTVTFFHHPNYDATITPLISPLSVGGAKASASKGVTAGEYLAQKLEALALAGK